VIDIIEILGSRIIVSFKIVLHRIIFLLLGKSLMLRMYELIKNQNWGELTVV